LARLQGDGRGEPTLLERTLARFFADGLITRRQGKIVFSGGRYRGRPDARETWRPRAEALPPEVARIAFAAAVLGEHIETNAVAKLTGHSTIAVQTVLAELAQRGFLA